MVTLGWVLSMTLRFNLVNKCNQGRMLQHADREDATDTRAVASITRPPATTARQWPELGGELDADVCIPGGGFTGLQHPPSTWPGRLQGGAAGGQPHPSWGASGLQRRPTHSRHRHDTSQFARWIGRQRGARLDLMGLEAGAAGCASGRAVQHRLRSDLGLLRPRRKSRHLRDLRRMPSAASLGYRHELRLVPKGEIKVSGGVGSLYRRHDRHGLKATCTSTWRSAGPMRQPAWSVALFRSTQGDPSRGMANGSGVTTARPLPRQLPGDRLQHAYLNELVPDWGQGAGGLTILATQVLEKRLRASGCCKTWQRVRSERGAPFTTGLSADGRPAVWRGLQLLGA